MARATRYSSPTVTADIPTNSGNVCEFWDASCHVQQGLDSINEGIVQAGEDLTTWGETTSQWIQGGFVEAGENTETYYKENFEDPIIEGIEGFKTWHDEQPTVNDLFINELDKAKVGAEILYKENLVDPFNSGIEYFKIGLDESFENAQKFMNEQTENYETWMNEARKNLEDSIAATTKAAQDAANVISNNAANAAANVVKSATDAASAAGEGATKGITDSLKIAGFAAVGLVGVYLLMENK